MITFLAHRINAPDGSRSRRVKSAHAVHVNAGASHWELWEGICCGTAALRDSRTGSGEKNGDPRGDAVDGAVFENMLLFRCRRAERNTPETGYGGSVAVPSRCDTVWRHLRARDDALLVNGDASHYREIRWEMRWATVAFM